MPERDRSVLDALPAADRLRLFNRLEAVWRANEGEPLGPLAELAGLGRAAFFNLRRAWGKHGLAGLVPHEARAARRVRAGDDDPRRASALAALRASPTSRNVDIARGMVAADRAIVADCRTASEELVVLQRLERLVQHERRDLAADPAFLKKAYGVGLALDLTAVSIVLDEPDPALAVVALLFETASGVLLGSALGRADAGSTLQNRALLSGLGFIERHRADAPSSARLPDLALTLGEGLEPGPVEQALNSSVRELVVGRAGSLAFGQHAVQLIGPRVGRMVMNPRRSLRFDVERFRQERITQLLSLDGARLVWAREVARHNEPRLMALREAGLVDGAGIGDGRLAAVIRATRAALSGRTLSGS